MRYFSLVFTFFILSSFSGGNDWFSFLGKTFQDGDVRAHFDAYGEFTSHDYRGDLETQINWTERGVAITMNDMGEIQKIYFFNDQYRLKHDVFSRFLGKLPLDVHIDMNPEKIKEKLGDPTEEKGDTYKVLTYRTTYEYEFLFKKGVLQYMRIGLLPKPNTDIE